MLYFVSQFRVYLLLWTLYVASTNSETNKKKMTDFGMVISFIENIIKPYLDDNHSYNDIPRLRTPPDKVLTEIKDVVKLKVKQLKPMLYDRENHYHTKIKTDNNLNLEGNDETVILDLMPEKTRRTKVKLAVKEKKKSTDTFQKKIENYKQLRQDIMLLLDKENTSNLTNKLITTTLDEMLALLIRKQCKWKSIYTADLMKHLDRDSRKSIQKVRNKGNILDGYRLACYLHPKDKGVIIAKYSGEAIPRTAHQCGTFIICSDELSDFLKITYSYLNNTAVATFRDYAAMYIRDVKKTTKHIDDIVTSELEDLSNYAENKVRQIFLNELKLFMLDENKNQIANIRHIKTFIKATTTQIKSEVSMHMYNKLNAMKIRNKLFSTIKDDLTVNLRVKLDNLNQLIADKICNFFILCNGIGTRRFNHPRQFRPKDSENVYFKVQLSFDDEMKDALARFAYQNRQGDMTSINSYGNSLIDNIGRRKYNYYVNVTRTSVGSTATTETVASSENMQPEQFF